MATTNVFHQDCFFFPIWPDLTRVDYIEIIGIENIARIINNSFWQFTPVSLLSDVDFNQFMWCLDFPAVIVTFIF